MTISGMGEDLKVIRVVAADDSAVMRSLLARLFAESDISAGESHSRVELCAAVADGQACVRVVRALRPDVVVLDLDMPGMSGLDTIDLLRHEWPGMPIIMCSTYTERGAAATLEALARGAADYVTKPSGQRDAAAAIVALREELLPKIIALALRRHTRTAEAVQVGSTKSPEEQQAPAQIVVIGVSTGGPTALEQLLPGLPKGFAAPVLIVQHMPKLFTRALAERLDRCCELRVQLGRDGAELQPGTIWLAPGDSHMEIAASTSGIMRIGLHQGPPVLHCRPAVDPLFLSVARNYGRRALGVVLTGMGADGLEGSRAIVAAGGCVLVQDQVSSAVWGMPGRVATAGLASAVLPIAALAQELVARTSRVETRSLYRSTSLRTEKEMVHGR
jgi:two-component system chemotaxis response regulator CheB